MPLTAWECFNPTFRVGYKYVGLSHPCFIIAEAGVSHFGSLDKAFALVEAASAAEADAVKFQHFKVEQMISSTNTEWVERMRPKQMSIGDYAKVKQRCDDLGIIFFASAHDEASLTELVDLGMPCIKIGSGELRNASYYKLAASFNLPIIASTGMHAETDIDYLLATLAASGCCDLALLHCVTQYPTPPEFCNLRAVETLQRKFSGPVGYSDHSPTQDIAAASAVLGAKVIERHITLEKNIPNAQDWKVSCLPDELKEFVASIRRLEKARGDGYLERGEGERQSLLWARKSLVAAGNLSAGSILKREDLGIKRPGTGIAPSELDALIGRRLKVFVKEDTILSTDMFE